VAYTSAIRDSPFIRAVVEKRLDFEWAVTRMISDDPAKGLGRAPPEKLFHEQLREIIGDPVSDVELVAGYWVPGTTGMERFLSMAKRGVKIKVMTNSLDAADGPWVYSGFSKCREPLLKAGITIYEMRRLSPQKTDNKGTGPLGSSGSSLHAKTFSVDRSRLFVGSFNFDPRSRKLNTELGFVIDSAVLAQTIEAAFDESIPADSFEVRLSDAGQLYWIDRRGDELVRHDTEPGTSRWLRGAVWLLSLLPIDWLL
jgi:putative cardiolipin synthase